jgi:biopolymer transport protein ExbD
MHVRSQSSLESNINVTPLVDVCLVLLIIFMLVLPAVVNGVPVKLPAAAHSEAGTPPRQLAVTVKDDGTVYLGAEVLRREQVAAELQRIHAQSPDRPVAVRADKTLKYGEVMQVLDWCRGAGFADVRLATAPGPPARAAQAR